MIILRNTKHTKPIKMLLIGSEMSNAFHTILRSHWICVRMRRVFQLWERKFIDANVNGWCGGHTENIVSAWNWWIHKTSEFLAHFMFLSSHIKYNSTRSCSLTYNNTCSNPNKPKQCKQTYCSFGVPNDASYMHHCYLDGKIQYLTLTTNCVVIYTMQL